MLLGVSFLPTALAVVATAAVSRDVSTTSTVVSPGGTVSGGPPVRAKPPTPSHGCNTPRMS